jgi:hypothetical protein
MKIKNSQTTEPLDNMTAKYLGSHKNGRGASIVVD